MTLSEIFIGQSREPITNFLNLRKNLNKKFGEDNWVSKKLTEEDKEILFKKEWSYFDCIVEKGERHYYLISYDKDGGIIHQKIMDERDRINFLIINDYFPISLKKLFYNSLLEHQNLPMRQSAPV